MTNAYNLWYGWLFWSRLDSGSNRWKLIYVNMFSLFSKKYWCYFYLPSELFYSLTEVSEKELGKLFKEENISFDKIQIQEISDCLYFISIAFKKEETLLLFEKYISRFIELLPPWLVFPNNSYGSPRWNQGYQEDYCIKNWLPYWNSLNENEKYDYTLKYNCPEEWREWLKETKPLWN